MTASTLFCRFCANEKPQQSLIDLKETNRLQQSVKQKLRIYTEEIVDFNDKYLPENICTSCYSTLNSSYEFFVQAKESQDVLRVICNDLQNTDLCTEPVKQEFCGLELDSWIDRESNTADDSWSSYSWRCSQCEMVLPRIQELRTHIQERHGMCAGFCCDDCKEVTVGFENFVEHVRQHRPALRKYCQYCNIKIETPAHIDTHNYNCKSCGQPFTSKKHLLSHLHEPKITLNNKPCNFDLEKCEEFQCTSIYKTGKLKIDTFDNETMEISDAVYSDDNTSNNKIPKLCDTPLKTTEDTKPKQRNNTDVFKTKHKTMSSKNHETTKNIKFEKLTVKSIETIDVWSDYPCICKYCGLKVANWGILKIHCISHHKKCFGMECVDCKSDDSYTWDLFAQHVIKHRPNLVNNCYYCHESIAESDHFFHLQTHKARFQCIACGQIFKNMRDFRCHDNKLEPPLLKPPNKRRTSPIKDEEVVCNVCFFRAKSPWFLKKHRLIHSDRPRDFTCERCGKAFMSKSCLDIHTKLHILHEGEPKETCKICGKSFFTMNKLRDHVKSHNLVMPYQCDDCKKFFRSKHSLRSHVIVHMDIRPFVCKYCPKKFRTKTTMQNHEYQHTGVRPFSCDICCLNFTCWSNCDKHLRRIHGMSLAKAIVTPYGKMEIDPATGKPRELSITNDLKEWTNSIIVAKKGRKKKSGQLDDTQKLNDT